MIFKKTFLSWWVMQFLEKLRKMWENIEILNKKKNNLFGITTKLPYWKVFHKTSINNRDETSKQKKTEILMNKPVYLGLLILELSKTLMYEFWYDYVKLKYNKKAQLCYMDTDSLIVYIKTHDFYKDIAEDVETRFDTSNYELECNYLLEAEN